MPKMFLVGFEDGNFWVLPADDAVTARLRADTIVAGSVKIIDVLEIGRISFRADDKEVKIFSPWSTEKLERIGGDGILNRMEL